MGPTLNMASEMQGYTMSDRGTWLAYQNKLDLEILFQGDENCLTRTKLFLLTLSATQQSTTKAQKLSVIGW